MEKQIALLAHRKNIFSAITIQTEIPTQYQADRRFSIAVRYCCRLRCTLYKNPLVESVGVMLLAPFCGVPIPANLRLCSRSPMRAIRPTRHNCDRFVNRADTKSYRLKCLY